MARRHRRHSRTAGWIVRIARRKPITFEDRESLNRPPTALPLPSPSKSLFHFQIIRDFVDFALPCCLHCPRLVFASRMIWKWNQLVAIVNAPGMELEHFLVK
jgi:hypothetical protein